MYVCMREYMCVCLSVCLAVVPPSAAAAVAQNLALQQQQQQQQQQQAASSALSQQIITNAQGQIVAIGAAQVNYQRLLSSHWYVNVCIWHWTAASVITSHHIDMLCILW